MVGPNGIVRVLSAPAGGTGDASSIERLDGSVSQVIPSCWPPIDKDPYLVIYFNTSWNGHTDCLFSIYYLLFSPISTRECVWSNLSLSSDMYKGVSPPCEWDIQSNPVLIHSFPSLLTKSLIIHSLSFPSQVYEVLVPCTPRCKFYFFYTPHSLVLAYITSCNMITTSTDYQQIKIPTTPLDKWDLCAKCEWLLASPLHLLLSVFVESCYKCRCPPHLKSEHWRESQSMVGGEGQLVESH